MDWSPQKVAENPRQRVVLAFYWLALVIYGVLTKDGTC